MPNSNPPPDADEFIDVAVALVGFGGDLFEFFVEELGAFAPVDGFGMLIPVLRDTHPRYSASRALSMNAPTQEVSMNIINTWEAFKDHKRM